LVNTGSLGGRGVDYETASGSAAMIWHFSMSWMFMSWYERMSWHEILPHQRWKQHKILNNNRNFRCPIP